MMHSGLLDAAVQFSLDTGGCLKFDLKAYDDEIYLALTGTSKQRTFDNLARAAWRYGERSELHLVVASTLLVPGYVDADQVARIAQFLAALDPRIPYALLGFAPQFHMWDLPCTSVRQAEEAETAARDAGLTNVRVGNRSLLGCDPV
jgi:pyruvate formate lyase activating enzyme